MNVILKDKWAGYVRTLAPILDYFRPMLCVYVTRLRLIYMDVGYCRSEEAVT